MIRTGVVVLFTLLVADAVCASDWPNPTGPLGNSSSLEALPRTDLQANPPQIAWSFPLLYRGYGAPVVDGNTVYILDRDPNTIADASPNTNDEHSEGPADQKWNSQPDRKTYLRAIDLDRGTENWHTSWIDEGSCRWDGIRAWPVFNGTRLFVSDHNGVLRCFDKQSHRQLWERLIGAQRVGKSMEGYTKSPVLYLDTVLTTHGVYEGKTQKLIVTACAESSGQLRWQTEITDCRGHFMTPAVMTIDGVAQLVVYGDWRSNETKAPGAVCGLDIREGKILWRFEDGLASEKSFMAAMPLGTIGVLIGDAGRFSNAGLFLLNVKKTASGWDVRKVFHQKNKKGYCQFHQPLAHGGRLYDYATRVGLACRNPNLTVSGLELDLTDYPARSWRC